MAKITFAIRRTGAGGEIVILKRWLYELVFASWLPATVASLAWALMVVAIWWALMSVLYRRRIFIKI